MGRQILIYLALVELLVWAILGSALAAYFYEQYRIYQEEYVSLTSQLNAISMKVNILLSLGEDRRTWHNDTLLPLGSTAFTALNFTAEAINSTDYGGEFGILVTSINGVKNNSTHGWFYWHWSLLDSKWVLPSYSSAREILHEGDTIAYTYVSYAEWPPPPPT